MVVDQLIDNIQWKVKQHERKSKKLEGLSEKTLLLLDGTLEGQLEYLKERATQCQMEIKSIQFDRIVKFRQDLIKKDRKTIVLASSAIRCIEICTLLKKDHDNVVKLFAKHKKIKDQSSYIQSKEWYLGVGTPQRVMKLEIMADLIIVDAAFVDKKKKTIFDHKDIRKDVILCLEEQSDAKICIMDKDFMEFTE